MGSLKKTLRGDDFKIRQADFDGNRRVGQGVLQSAGGAQGLPVPGQPQFPVQGVLADTVPVLGSQVP